MQSLKQYFTRLVRFIRGQDVRNDRDQIKRFFTILGLAVLLGVMISPLAILATHKSGGPGQVLAPTPIGGAATTAPGKTPGGPGLTPSPIAPNAPVKGLTDNPAYQWWRWPNHPQPDSWWGEGQNAQTLGDQVSLMQELGVKIFRPELVWAFVAPTRPGGSTYNSTLARDPNWSGYQWSRWDLIVQLTSAAGIQLDPQVVYTPDWASGVTATVKDGPRDTPLSTQYYADFVYAAVMRYKGQIHYWEMWNEPDLSAHTWKDADTTKSLQSYVNYILKPGYEAAKQADPTVQVVLGGLGSDVDMGKIYAAGGGPYFDIGNFHAYYEASSADSTAMDHVRAAMNENGDQNKPLWLTEFGWSASTASDEAVQANLVAGVYKIPHLQAIFYYQLHDTAVYDPPGTPIKQVYWGLVSHDLTQHKPAFDAYQSARGGGLPNFALVLPGGVSAPAASFIWSVESGSALWGDHRQRIELFTTHRRQ